MKKTRYVAGRIYEIADIGKYDAFHDIRKVFKRKRVKLIFSLGESHNDGYIACEVAFRRTFIYLSGQYSQQITRGAHLSFHHIKLRKV